MLQAARSTSKAAYGGSVKCELGPWLVHGIRLAGVRIGGTRCTFPTLPFSETAARRASATLLPVRAVRGCGLFFLLGGCLDVSSIQGSSRYQGPSR